jgi:hypothetical protein
VKDQVPHPYSSNVRMSFSDFRNHAIYILEKPFYVEVSDAAYKLQLELTDSSVGTTLGYGLDNRGYRVRFPAGTGNFSLRHRVQNGSGARPASYLMGTGGSFPGGKAAGA